MSYSYVNLIWTHGHSPKKIYRSLGKFFMEFRPPTIFLPDPQCSVISINGDKYEIECGEPFHDLRNFIIIMTQELICHISDAPTCKLVHNFAKKVLTRKNMFAHLMHVGMLSDWEYT